MAAYPARPAQTSRKENLARVPERYFKRAWSGLAALNPSWQKAVQQEKLLPLEKPERDIEEVRR
jgi:hypothetical protein